jgi:histidinol-phosphate aminotransferase
MSGLDSIGVAYLPSHGNFLLIRVADAGKGAARVYEALLRSGVIVRPVANYGLPDWLRVTVGLPEENARFLSALGAALGR